MSAGGPGAPELRWHEKLDAGRVTLAAFAVAVAASAATLRGPGRELDYGANLLRFIRKFFPPDFSVAGETFGALVETVQIAVLATAAAIGLSLPLAVAGAQNLSPRWLALSARMALNGIRTIPSLVWAMIAVAVVGANPVAGVAALTLYSVGYLGKFFSDAFESADTSVARELRAAGADAVQAFQFGLWPGAKPLVWSYSLWMVEYNIRSAAIIGYVGAGGIGLQLHAYQEFHQWDKFAAVLAIMLALVTVLDVLGERIRARIAPTASDPRKMRAE